MDYLIMFVIIVGAVSLFSKDKGSRNRFYCSTCKKKCSHTYIESIRGYNRMSEYYTCDCCGRRFTNDIF